MTTKKGSTKGEDASIPSTGLAVITVPESIRIIEEKIRKLKHISESVYVTGGKIHGFNNAVKDETDKGTLVKMMASVIAKEQAYSAAADRLGFETVPVFKADGHTVAEWEQDIRLRFDVIDNQSRLDELKAIKREAEELMDKNDRMALLQKRIQGLK